MIEDIHIYYYSIVGRRYLYIALTMYYYISHYCVGYIVIINYIQNKYTQTGRYSSVNIYREGGIAR